jgi:hypothetical protein
MAFWGQGGTVLRGKGLSRESGSRSYSGENRDQSLITQQKLNRTTDADRARIFNAAVEAQRRASEEVARGTQTRLEEQVHQQARKRKFKDK